MNEERLFTLRNSWFVWSVGSTVAIAIVSILIGFVWLPARSSAFGDLSLWARICGAAGVPSIWYSGNETSQVPSNVVVLPPSGQGHPMADSIGRGATIATQHCSMCHGVVANAPVTAPPLAGQYADVIYKEMRDFQSGQRPSAVMQEIIAARSDQDLHDLAVYYASLPRAAAVEKTRAGEGPDATAVRLVMQGDPQRNIAPCAACHGELDRKGAAPWLGGMSAVYLAAELHAFASGARHNDINEQMRNVARQMSPEEIDAVARYYAAMQ
ncbi:cytochrome c class I [Burkholderia sp. H160]|nr:cytochrome c class I [Burkholderia sp. H160]